MLVDRAGVAGTVPGAVALPIALLTAVALAAGAASAATPVVAAHRPQAAAIARAHRRRPAVTLPTP